VAKILLIERDPGIVRVLSNTLARHNYLVDVAQSSSEGLAYALGATYDLIVLDLELPEADGLELCRRLRGAQDPTPLLLLTAAEDRSQKVRGLDAGADDCLVKPFAPAELLALVRALLRRGVAQPRQALCWGALVLRPDRCEVTYAERPVPLTAKEHAMLELFLRNGGRVFSQAALLDRLWPCGLTPMEGTVRAHLKSLRQKLRRAGAPADLIETVYGIGYRLRATETDVAARVLVVDDERSVLEAVARVLAPKNWHLRLLDDPSLLWQSLHAHTPDLLVLDADLSGASGLHLCRQLRNTPRWSSLPVLVLCERDDGVSVHAIFEAGASDYVCKPVIGPELVARIFHHLEPNRLRR